jgi:hypothetical protein
MNEDPPRQMIVIVTAEAASLCSALEHIKSGRLERAIELLEQGLDRCVMCLGDMRKKTQPADQENLTNALKVVRTYWHRHPRHAKPEMSGTALADVQEIAQQILKKLES